MRVRVPQLNILQRNFKFIAMLGFASTVLTVWESVFTSVAVLMMKATWFNTVHRIFAFDLTDGGTGILFWGFIIATFGMSFVYASVSEIESM